LAGGWARSEGTEAGEVDRGGEQGEVGGDLCGAANAGAARTNPTAAAASRRTLEIRIITTLFAVWAPERPLPATVRRLGIKG